MLDSIKYNKKLNNEELYDLAIKGCKESKDALILNNIPLVKMIAEKVWRRTRTGEIEDMVGSALIYLLEYWKGYDPQKGKFSTYVTLMIRTRLSNSLRSVATKKNSKYRSVSLDNHTDSDNENTYHEIISSEQQDFNIDISRKDIENLIKEIDMPESAKQTVILKIFEDMTFTAIAQKMGFTRQAAQSLWKKYSEKVKEEIKIKQIV